jgi:hypothetical protein
MKKLILIALISIGISAQAQVSYFEIVRFCEADSAYLLTVTTAPEVYEITIMPSHTATIEAPIDSAGRYRFAIPKANEWAELRVLAPNPQIAPMLYFDDALDCEKTELAHESIPMNECLGLSAESLGLPVTGVFQVDGNEYTYSDNLSFLVPMNSVWLWNFSAYEISFQFAQGEGEACHILAGD